MCGRFSVLLTLTLVFGCLAVVGVMQETSGGKLSRTQYIKLWKSFIEKAKEQHLKLLQKDVDRRKGLRQRRSTNTTQMTSTSSYDQEASSAQNVDKGKRIFVSYDSAKYILPTDKDGLGLKLNATFSEVNGTWKVNISWNKPSREVSFPDNQSNRTGYEICLSGRKRDCRDVEDENVTSYTFNDSNGWKPETDPPLIIVAVYSLPRKNVPWYGSRSLYGCRNKITVDPVNGYDPSSSFIKLNVTFIKVEEKWKAIVNWSKPVQENQRRCTGYEILWYELEGITHCDVISDENVTSHTIESGYEQWEPDKLEPELLVAVHPLPKLTNRIDYGGKFWQFNACQDGEFRPFRKITVKPGKRSAAMSWKYELKSDDTGYKFTWNIRSSIKRETITLNRTAKSYVFTGLVPFSRYEVVIRILYGTNCISIRNFKAFTTLEDYPGLPRIVNVATVNSSAINVRWFPPEFPNGVISFYRFFWKAVDTSGEYKTMNVSSDYIQLTLVNLSNHSSYYLVVFLENNARVNRNASHTPFDRTHALGYFRASNTNYSIQMMAVNSYGNGNKTILSYASTQPVARPRTVLTTGTTLTQETTLKPGTTLTPETTPTPGTTPEPNATSVTGGRNGTPSGVIAGTVVAVGVFVVLLVIGFCFLRRREMRKLRQESVRSFHEMHGLTSDESVPPFSENEPAPVPGQLPSKVEPPDEISCIVLLDDWEILRENLKVLEKKLGGGQFGIVKQGLYSTGKNDPEVVAVKMLKANASASDRSDLLTELKILKEVNKEPHPNVIRLIGACSNSEPILVVTEFCPGGNLRKFLLNSRVDSPDDSPTYINITSSLTHRQLLKIATDVASGMMHLASNKFVHRDLAARNILIGEDDFAKVSDFGLARDVGEEEEYVRTNQNLLPVKWMALESLLYGRFTTASDIWSFGVLLYEITTLGKEPYSGISPHNIVSHVGSGCRMERPEHCSEEVYSIMRNCWKNNPNDRPCFKEIHEALISMLTDEEKSYINVTQIIDEGPLHTDGHKISVTDGSLRYTTA